MPPAVVTLCLGLPTYPSVVLGDGGPLSARVFLPPSCTGGEAAFYMSTRFDWGSMVGDLRAAGRRVCPPAAWRTPHDPSWPESGVGFAMEFGCGDDGSTCTSTWPSSPPATNGVLGYDEASPTGAFLKIGVGRLRRNASDATYRFNAPDYVFDAAPSWRIDSLGSNVVSLSSRERLGSRWGYDLRRRVEVNGEKLIVTSVLTNAGTEPIITPVYSHNFVAVDSERVGAGWCVHVPGLNVSAAKDSPWAVPMASVLPPCAEDALCGAHPVQPGQRLKCALPEPPAPVLPAYAVSVPGLAVTGRLELGRGMTPLLFAYNVYVEERVVCPEPIALIHIAAGEEAEWALHVTVTDSTPRVARASPKVGGQGSSAPTESSEPAAGRVGPSCRAAPLLAGGLTVGALVLWRRRQLGRDPRREPLVPGKLEPPDQR